MKSIRVCVMLCFLVLLVLALGAVSALAYQTSRHTLLEKKQATRDLLEAQHNERVQEISAKLDAELLSQARSLASLTQQWQSLWTRPRLPSSGTGGARIEDADAQRPRLPSLFPLAGLGLASAAGPSGYVQVPAWSAEWGFNALGFRLYQMLALDVQFGDFALLHADQSEDTQYYQVHMDWGDVWRSPSLDGHTLPLRPETFPATELFDWRFDDTQLKHGAVVRRIILKAPASRFRAWPPPRHQPQRSSERGRSAEDGITTRTGYGQSRNGAGSPNERPRFQDVLPPAIYIQCASSARERDAAIQASQAGLDDALQNLDAESDLTLASLRSHLALIGLATFAATVIGGFWLVQLGLTPLRRLSEAVSRVSAKDFRLPLEEREVPWELRPVVGRLGQTLTLLQRAFAREKQAAADISHDLRTPIAALLTTTEVALRKPRSPEEYREILVDCRATGQQMSQMVERLLSLARLDAGADTLRAREVDVAALADQCAAMVRPLAEARGLALRVHRNGPLQAQVDPDKLREVLTNLLHNAIEYNRPQGSVDVMVERHNGRLDVEVRDTGIGIPPEAREHIFERFFRVDPARQTDGLHAGLGLAIVKGYVDLMGGTIEVASTPSEGTRFCVHLPVR